MSINNYLSNLKDTFEKQLQTKSVTYFVTIGNEASDLDSIASSILLAFFLSSTRSSTNEVHVPIINIPREDFSLRTETTWLFSELGLDKNSLLFFPELEASLDLLNSQNRLALILVDHNILANHQTKYSKAVYEIIDHHKDEKLYLETTSTRRIIELVGSCNTLVATKLLEPQSSLSNKNFIETFEKKEAEKIIRILIGTILLDTANLDPVQKKATPKDLNVLDRLSSITGYSKDFMLFDQLQQRRFDQSSLSTYDLLRVDYKQFTMNEVEVGISSTKVSLKDWINKDSTLVKDLETYCNAKKLDILFVMIAYFDSSNKLVRELVSYTKRKELLQPVISFLKSTDLELTDIDVDTALQFSKKYDCAISFHNQKNTAASRKQLQPFLSDFYKKK